MQAEQQLATLQQRSNDLKGEASAAARRIQAGPAFMLEDFKPHFEVSDQLADGDEGGSEREEVRAAHLYLWQPLTEIGSPRSVI